MASHVLPPCFNVSLISPDGQLLFLFISFGFGRFLDKDPSCGMLWCQIRLKKMSFLFLPQLVMSSKYQIWTGRTVLQWG